MPSGNDDVREGLFAQSHWVTEQRGVVFLQIPALRVNRLTTVVAVQALPGQVDAGRVRWVGEAPRIEVLQALCGAGNDGVVDTLHQLVAPKALTQALVVGELSGEFCGEGVDLSPSRLSPLHGCAMLPHHPFPRATSPERYPQSIPLPGGRDNPAGQRHAWICTNVDDKPAFHTRYRVADPTQDRPALICQGAGTA